MAQQEAEQSSSTTVLENESQTDGQGESATVRLVLKKPKHSKKVNWTNETVDNEHMGKRKSKCCCIYKKPHVFGESSSESDDDECENCSGHCERRDRDRGGGGSSNGDNNNDPQPSAPPVS